MRTDLRLAIAAGPEHIAMMTIDTLSYVKRLEAAGVPRPQAEAQAEVLRDDVAPQLATKLDLDATADPFDAKIDAAVVRLAGQIQHTNTDLRAELAKMESRIEAMMTRLSVALLLGVLASGSFIVRFLR